MVPQTLIFFLFQARLTCPCCNMRKKDAVLTKCFHVFCFECVKTRYDTRQRKCPKCNAAFGANDFHRIYIGWAQSRKRSWLGKHLLLTTRPLPLLSLTAGQLPGFSDFVQALLSSNWRTLMKRPQGLKVLEWTRSTAVGLPYQLCLCTLQIFQHFLLGPLLLTQIARSSWRSQADSFDLEEGIQVVWTCCCGGESF